MTREEIQLFQPADFFPAMGISCAGVSVCDGSYLIRRPAQKIFIFEYVERGSGWLKVGDRMFSPSAGSVYMAPGWKPHSYGSSADNPWVKHWFNLYGPLVEHLLAVYGIGEHYYYPHAEEAGEYLKDGVQRLKTVRPPGLSDFIEPFFFGLVRRLAASAGVRMEEKGESPEAVRLKAFLRSRITSPAPSLAEMAKEIGRSPVQTIRIFRNAAGTTPYGWLLNAKIDAACELLRNSGMAVKEIAGLLGFRDEYYFARLFRRRRGVSPGKFRRSL